MHVNLHVFTDVASSNSRRTSKLSKACRVSNIPLQKWTHITITTNNRVLDTYIDGKLVKLAFIKGPPVDGTASVRICDNNGGDSKNDLMDM